MGEMFDDTTALMNFLNDTAMSFQDITVNEPPSFVNETNARTPNKVTGNTAGMASTGVGRTMKDYEDQLSALKKENFNLKLRIYFLEERMGITSADEDAIKKNIELKVEIESLRKELVKKQELLSQAARAIELIEQQKETSARNQVEYEQSLENERKRIAELENELEEYRKRGTDESDFYQETFGITPERALENQEKLRQMEELVVSLELEIKQITNSLQEERNWAQELETERDQFRERLEAESRLHDVLNQEKQRDVDELQNKLSNLQDQLIKIEQQHKYEIMEKDRIIKDRTKALEEKSRTYDEVVSISEKRKKQIEQLRASVIARDNAITDLNNKHRALLSQFENGYAKRSPPSSPSTINSSFDERHSPRMLHKSYSPTKNNQDTSEYEVNRDRVGKAFFSLPTSGLENRNANELSKDTEEKNNLLKQQEDIQKQLTLKLFNMEKLSEWTDKKLRKLESENIKALKAIQGFMKREQEMNDLYLKKEQEVKRLQSLVRKMEAEKSKEKIDSAFSIERDSMHDISENPVRDDSNQQRFEEMERKINELCRQIDDINSEKSQLESQIKSESEELQDQLRERDQKIIALEKEREQLQEDMEEKNIDYNMEKEKLMLEVNRLTAQVKEKEQKIEQLTKELQVKNQNLQKLVNTELWSKNKEIAKLHNHMTASQSFNQEINRKKSDVVQESSTTQLDVLVKELNAVGIQVTFTNDIVQLNYVNGNDSVDIKTMTEYIQKLIEQKNELEKDLDYIKWLNIVKKSDIGSDSDSYENETERRIKSCELLRMHLKDLVKFMKEILKNADDIDNDHTKAILTNSKLLSDSFMHALEGLSTRDVLCGNISPFYDDSLKKNEFHGTKNLGSTQSDSEAFSEPDRTVSMARIGLQEIQNRSSVRPRIAKYCKTFSDSEDSLDYAPYYKTHQTDQNLDFSSQFDELKELSTLLYFELGTLRKYLKKVTLSDENFEKFAPLISSVERTQHVCERIKCLTERKFNDFGKKENRQCLIRKTPQSDKKVSDIEIINNENNENKSGEIYEALSVENERLNSRIIKLEDENKLIKMKIMNLSKELDHCRLSQSQLLVDNSKLTKENLKLEQEIRKVHHESAQTSQEKYLQDIHDDANSLQTMERLQEHEATNKELQRTICETSDSAPSSSGVSSIPSESLAFDQQCSNALQGYPMYNNPLDWLPANYRTQGARSKSSCSPDLGIESDAAGTITRPLKDTLKITESMTNLLSDDEINENGRDSKISRESPPPLADNDEIFALKQENLFLKKTLRNTRRTLENTFQHVSASNINKKYIGKAIAQQLSITKNILKKTKTYEEPAEDS